MSPELQPMAVQYYCHMSPYVTCDQYNALPLEGVLVTWCVRMSCMYRSTPEILRFYPIPSFFLYSPFKRL